MYAFLYTQKPLSINAKGKKGYQENLRLAFQKAYRSNQTELLKGPLYGLVYYFCRASTKVDADNISKPIWDALQGVVYEDDSVIQLRKSGIVDLNGEDYQFLDFTLVPEDVGKNFFKVLGSQKQHILYIEIGRFDPEMFLFGIEKTKKENKC